MGHLSETVVDDHDAAAEATERFLTATSEDESCVVIVAGGGGTLRAVVEGACRSTGDGPLPGAERLRIAPLRMGSGNVLAKKLGVPSDPVEALPGLLRNVREGASVPVCVGRYAFARGDGPSEIRFAVTLAGLGQLGRVPGDLERWHRRLPWLRKTLATMTGIERLTDLEYALALIVRFACCAVSPTAAESVVIDGTTRCILAGAVLNFRVGALPFVPTTELNDPTLELYLMPRPSRWSTLTAVLAPRRLARTALQVTIDAARPVTLRLVDRESVEMFLDEDPIRIDRSVTIGVAGTLAFVPGAGAGTA